MLQYYVMKKMKWMFLIICIGITCFSGIVSAQINPEEYDKKWIKRNPQSRLEVLERSFKHYLRALAAFQRKDFQEAEIAATDALKVVPEFKEAYELLAAIAEARNQTKKAERFFEKAIERMEPYSILEEREYLHNNLERLKQNYKPSYMLNRIVFYLLFCVGYAIILFLLSTSGVLTQCGMFFRRIIRKKEESKGKEDMPNLIVEEFPGDREESASSFWVYGIVYIVPFVLCFSVAYFAGARTLKELSLFTILPGVVILVVLYKLFLGDDEGMPPRKWGM